MISLAGVPLLSLLIWVPILGGLWVAFVGSRVKPAAAKWDAFLISLAVLVLSLLAWDRLDPSSAAMQLTENHEWIPAFNIRYQLGIDGIALSLILLTTLMTVLVIAAAWHSISQRPAQYLGAFLILAGLMNGVFAARDAILFYVFWEAMLIPMFLIIGIWGGQRRVYAAIKFFLYTFLGSVFLLLAILYIYFRVQSFDMGAMTNLRVPLEVQKWLFVAFFLGFAVKVPMVPVHTWLPDAHVEAPTGGSVILAAIMLKMGIFGFVRFALPMTPHAAAFYADAMIVLSLIAIVYIGLVALAQDDMKKLIAYSSISHMGFVTLGLFLPYRVESLTGTWLGAELPVMGAMMQMISHGFISGALFLCVGVLYDRMHSRAIKDYGGVVNTMPIFAALMMVFCLANAGLPGTSGFIGEFMVIVASIRADFLIAAAAALTLVLGAAYTLWLVKRVLLGAVANEQVAKLYDVTTREKIVLLLLALLVIGVGCYPAPLVNMMSSSVDGLVAAMGRE